MRVVFDTGAADERLLATARAAGLDVSFVSVSAREAADSSFAAIVNSEGSIPEAGIYGESQFDSAIFASDADSACVEQVLKIISSGAFPLPGARDELPEGQRHQLRDALIFCGCVRDGFELFVTTDKKGFINSGRRERLESDYKTRIMTPEEFLRRFGALDF